MKKILLIFSLLLLLVSTSFAQDKLAFNMGMAGGGVGGAASCADTSCTGFIVCQNFEGTGYDNSESWYASGGSGYVINPDYTTTILRGSQSDYLYSGTETYAYNRIDTFTAAGEVYFHALWNPAVVVSGDYSMVVQFSTAADAGNFTVYRRTGNVLSVSCGGAESLTVGAFTPTTTYRLWGHYKKGTGANAECSIEFTAISTKSPTGTGDNYIARTNGTRTTDVERIHLRTAYETSASTSIFDQVLLKTTAITNVCD